MTVLKVPVTSEDHIQGNPKAPITLVEYGDYQCPYCGQAYPIVKQLQEYFGDQLCFVFRNFPLTEVHEYAKASACTAEFAGTYNKFWEMHDLLYENQENLDPEHIKQLVESLGLNTHQLENAMREGTFDRKIQKDFMGGVRSGVNGTPSFFINDHRFNGSYDYDSLVNAIEAELTQKA